MRAGVIAAAVAAWPGAAAAEPRFEASGFFGVTSFGDDTELGNSWAPEQVPGTAGLVGVRLGWIALPALFEHRGARGQLGIEGEASIAPAFTGEAAGARRSYFAPVFGAHAHAWLRVAWPAVQAHLVLGGGAETVASSSPFMSKETDPVGYWGLGVALPVTERWRLRLDARHGVMADRGDGVSSTLAIQLGMAAAFGTSVGTAPRERVVEAPPVVDLDLDDDGIADVTDRCPREPETVNDLDDADGCPELDTDGDAIFGAADRCPDVAEDRDGFADDDGCPELDNDGDQLADAVDRCPNEAETVDGFTDDDGCPDGVPAAVTRALADAAKLRFARGSARLDPAGQQLLRGVLAMLRAHRAMAIVIVAHPASAREEALARRRGRAAKWFLVDAGVMPDRIEVEIGAVAKAPQLELRLAPPR